jgi:hypothetical protein
MRGRLRGKQKMPKKSKELSALSVARIKETGRYHVGGVDGLCLNVERIPVSGFYVPLWENVWIKMEN